MTDQEFADEKTNPGAFREPIKNSAPLRDVKPFGLRLAGDSRPHPTLADVLPWMVHPRAGLKPSCRVLHAEDDAGCYVVEWTGYETTFAVYRVYHDGNYDRVSVSGPSFSPLLKDLADCRQWIDEYRDALEALATDPRPRPGDLVWFPADCGDSLAAEKVGTIESGRYPALEEDDGEDFMQVNCAYSRFRTAFSVSCSGGPVPAARQRDLTFAGFSAMATFWRWKHGQPGADRGVDYDARVPVWIYKKVVT